MFGLFGKRKTAAAQGQKPEMQAELPIVPGPDGYSAFTTEFDREVAAATLLDELGWNDPGLRGERDRLVSEFGAASAVRAKAAKRSIEFQARWRGGHDLGPRPLVTVLIDHSGSMRGPKSWTAAITADVIGDILQHERIAFEVLGFTTSSWHGGRSRKRWLTSHMSPMFPGRLCDLLHIVYRDADGVPQSWHRNLILLLDKNVLKENVDGEALLWAHRRAAEYNPTSWVCLLLSDGAPVDDATIQANAGENNSWYLYRHLAQVVGDLNNESGVRLGRLSLDQSDDEPSPFMDVSQVDVLEDAPSLAFDLLENLIWPRGN